jgi:predicted nucleic acid-binding protein
MRVLLDLNIILDVLLNRAPWVTDSAATWDAHRAGEIVAHVAAFAVPTVFYVLRRQSDLQRAHDGVRICLESLEVAPVERSTLELTPPLSPEYRGVGAILPRFG